MLFLVRRKKMILKLNVYSDQKDTAGKKAIVKTYVADEFDLMYGTVEDVLTLFADVDMKNNMQMLKTISKGMKLLNPILKDVFDGLTDEELKHVKVKELVPVMMKIVTMATSGFAGDSKN